EPVEGDGAGQVGDVDGDVDAGPFDDDVACVGGAGEDVLAPRGRLVEAEQAGGVELVAERLGDTGADLVPDGDLGVVEVGLGDRDDDGQLFGDEGDVLPLLLAGLLEAGVAVDEVGGRQDRQ